MLRGMPGALFFRRLLKQPSDAAAKAEDEGPEAPSYGRGASFGRIGASAPHASANPGGIKRTLSRKLTIGSMNGSGRPSGNPGLKRTLTRKLSTIAPGPAEVAAANADDIGEVVIEVVLATGLRKPNVGPMIGPAQCAPPSPFVKLAVRGSEQRSRKEERTNYPMWNERLIWPGKRGALCTPKMHVEVLAWDPLIPTSMGRAEVDLAELLVGTACEMMVALGEV